MSPSKQTLDLRKTIETTLRRAQGWSYGVYPSAQLNDKKIKIDVRYFGENIPSLVEETPNIKKYQTKVVDYQKKPVYVCFRRERTTIELKRDLFMDFNHREKTSYSLHIHAGSGHEYSMVENPDGETLDYGCQALVALVQKDKDFGFYISFIFKNDPEQIASNPPRWPLSEIMTKTESLIAKKKTEEYLNRLLSATSKRYR